MIVQALSKLLTCRRSIIALTGMIACVLISRLTNTDTSGSVALIATSIAGANAAQAVFQTRKRENDANENP